MKGYTVLFEIVLRLDLVEPFRERTGLMAAMDVFKRIRLFGGWAWQGPSDKNRTREEDPVAVLFGS